jgi:chromate transport protein ChrA
VLPPPAPRRNWRLGLFEVVVAISVWAVLMPYTGRAFGMRGDSAIREIVALTVPGVIALLTAAWWARRLQAASVDHPVVAVPDWVIGLLFLCGLWMVGTHLKMASEVPSGRAEIDVAFYHVLPGLAIMVLAAWLYVLYGRPEAVASDETTEAADLEPQPTAG